MYVQIHENWDVHYFFSCLRPWIASLAPCAAAFVHHFLAFEYDDLVPSPFAYILPKVCCAFANSCSAANV